MAVLSILERSIPAVLLSLPKSSIPKNEHFNREKCYAQVLNLLKDGWLAQNATVFFRDRTGTTMSDPANPVLTLPGCNALCGNKHGWYVDAGPRLSTWIIPVFLLLSNMDVSPLDKRRYLMLLHLLGDPIDSLWCLLLKVDAWSRCYGMALRIHGPRQLRKVRNLATVLCGIEELVGFHANPLDVYNSIISQSGLTPEELDALIGRTAQHLADSRTDERLRTLLSTALYFYQLLSAFVSVVGGGNTSPPGGRIGAAMFMTWIIPTILLSNAIGSFTSIRTCFNVIERFSQDATGQSDSWIQLQQAVPALRCHATIDDYFDSLGWSGAIYTYRPTKRIPFRGGSRDRNAYTLLALAVSPIIISSVIASVILWDTPPIAINCRSYLIFSITIHLFGSTAFTWLTARLGVRGSTHWQITLIKDALLAIPSVILIFLATAGLFNSCWCWSGVYSLGKNARVPLNPEPQFRLYDRTVYPILVGVCLVLQLLSFAAMMWVSWTGWRLMRWSEKEKRDEWMLTRQRVKPMTQIESIELSSPITTTRDDPIGI